MATILIAGDDFAALTAIGAAVEAEGHRLIEAHDGFDAVRYAVDEAPDLIVLETSMAVFNGFQASRMLRDDPAVPASVPILLLSGNEIDVRAVERAGATAALAKQTPAAVLRELLVRYLGPKAAP